ncbi:equilibrative nucleoside transporter 1 [Clonorchis sinensis]|uniref:Equilibrative nucleoside transporter 1 n=1 Tax=Clonorchis sinensis TaxID=79923 RepID=G7YKI3_CLOSI|nr:equilibrative nucleoside transporter 1 [Clonorchis sinensis]
MLLLTVILVYLELGAAAIIQGSLLGIASVLPPRNIRAFLEGQASSGVIAAVAQILSLAGSSLITNSAFAYFLVALVFLGLSTALTLSLKRNAHFRYYWKAESTHQTKEEKSKDKDASASGLSADTLDTLVESNDERKTSPLAKSLLKSLGEMWVHGCCVMITLMFTLMLFPALLQPIKSMIDDAENVWASRFFIPVIVFLSFNVFDWIGRTLAGFIKWPRVSQRWILLGLCLARMIFVPLCMFMNQQPRKHLPVVFLHDAYPIILVILLGLTNGYFVSLGMTYGPSFASPGTNESAGAALSIYMSLGLSFGVAVSAGLALAI